jgi:hypothetical protein
MLLLPTGVEEELAEVSRGPHEGRGIAILLESEELELRERLGHEDSLATGEAGVGDERA